MGTLRSFIGCWLGALASLRPATFVAFHRDGVDMTLGFFVVPLLIRRPPNLPFATDAADKGAIDIVIGQAAVSVDVIEFCRFSGHG